VSEVVGRFEKEKYAGSVYPAVKRKGFPLFIPRGKTMGAATGDIVAARVFGRPQRRSTAEGEIIEIISRAGERNGEMKAIARACGIVPEFPGDVLSEAVLVANAELTDGDAMEGFPAENHLRSAVTDSNADADAMKGRRDLRGETIFTIDGADAKDFDDAVSIRKLTGGNYLLGVHIADVTHYVREDGALDREALRRGTSVYMPGLVVPMLPEALSNGICSLNEGVDRLTLTVEMEVDGRGKVVGHEIYESVIRSRARLVYDDVSDYIEKTGAEGGQSANKKTVIPNPLQGGDGASRRSFRNPVSLSGTDADIPESLIIMRDLANILIAARSARGSIDFDINEAEIDLDADGAPVHIGVRDRRIANRLIEEFMVLANETVAAEYFRKHMPFIYRVHERPDPDRMLELSEFLRGFDLRLGCEPGSVKPLDLAKIFTRIKGRPEENMVSEVMLRSMRKAEYSPDSLGHFGLALRHYCHFTSPIRRYPDLFIHRVIKEDIHGRMTSRRARDLRIRAARAAASSSATEQAAAEAEREGDRAKMVEYMVPRVGESFPAVINGVTGFGIFAELDNTINGLVHKRDLRDDHYEYSEEEYLLRGRYTGKELRLGDRLTVTVKSVDVINRSIDFTIK
jgi:ribonuclease R